MDRIFDIEKCYKALKYEYFGDIFSTELCIKLSSFNELVKGLSSSYYDSIWNYNIKLLCFDSLNEEVYSLLMNHENYEIHEVLLMFRMYTSLQGNTKRMGFFVPLYGDYIRKARSYKPGQTEIS